MKKKTIIIAGKPFTYDDEAEDITYDTLTPISEEDALELLALTKKLFDQCGIRFYLAYGTLLGAVRDKGIIKGDEDVDVFIDSEEELRRNLSFLYENGLKICRIEEHILYSFHVKDKSFIDVYIKEELPTSIWSFWCCSIEGHAVPKWYVNRYDTIEFLGMKLLCPHKPERILRHWYGNKWRIPQSGHVYTYELPLRHWWLKKGKEKYEDSILYVKYFFLHPIDFWTRAIKRLFRFF